MSLYRIQFDGGFRHVEAPSFSDAIALWNVAMIDEFGAGEESGWSGNDEPESVSVIDDAPVIRERDVTGAGREPCNGSCDIALARRQVGPDGIVPSNARECAELWEREASRLNVLLSAYRYKYANDGLNGRTWDAGKHLAAEDRIDELERKP